MDSIMSRSDMKFNEELLMLLQEGDESVEKVKEILNGSLLCHAMDSSGATLMHYSVQYKNITITQYLLDNGCDVNIQDSSGTTPLMIATMGNQAALITMLLAAEADIFKLNNQEKSVLHMMSAHCDMLAVLIYLRELNKKCSWKEVAEKLLEVNCPLYHAVLLKDSRVINYMLDRCPHLIDLVHPTSKDTSLHMSCLLDDFETAAVLLKYGANVNALDFMNATPIHNVYKMFPKHSCAKIEILKILCSRGASMTSCISDGAFQVINTLVSGDCKAVHVLLESGLDFNFKDNQIEQTVVHYLACNDNPGVADELKQYVKNQKFNINSCDKYEQTPLLIAVEKANVAMVKIFLKLGAKTDIKSSTCRITPLYCAYKCPSRNLASRYHECGDMLLQYYADPQFILVRKTGESVTILDAAVEDEDFNRIKPVIAHLALLQKLGTQINEIIWTKLQSENILKNYFEKCKELLMEQISGRLVLFDLLISDKKMMAKYSNDEDTDEKIRNQCKRLKMLDCRYYFCVLSRRYLEGYYYKKLKYKAARLICKFFHNQIHKTNLIVDNIINYLDHSSLRQISLLYYDELSNHRAILTSSRNKLQADLACY